MIQLRWVTRTRMIHDGGSAVGQSYDVLQYRESVAYDAAKEDPWRLQVVWSDWADVPHAGEMPEVDHG